MLPPAASLPDSQAPTPRSQPTPATGVTLGETYTPGLALIRLVRWNVTGATPGIDAVTAYESPGVSFATAVTDACPPLTVAVVVDRTADAPEEGGVNVTAEPS